MLARQEASEWVSTERPQCGLFHIGANMILLPGEGAQILNDCIQNIIDDRLLTIDLNDALRYAERAVVRALLTGQKQVILDLDHVVPLDRAQSEVKDLFKEHSQNIFSDKCSDVIEELFPDIK